MAILLKWLIGFFPSLLSTFSDMYVAKLKAEGDQDVLRQKMASQAMDLEATQMQLQTQLKIANAGRWYTVENLFGYATLLFYSKVLLWDKALGWGTTDALHGDVSTWAAMVIAFFFGHVTVTQALRIWRAK